MVTLIATVLQIMTGLKSATTEDHFGFVKTVVCSLSCCLTPLVLRKEVPRALVQVNFRPGGQATLDADTAGTGLQTRYSSPILSSIPGMSILKQVVIDFLVSKLLVIYHPLISSYLALSKNIGKNYTTHDVCCKSNIY
jgi:hypothetical protein